MLTKREKKLMLEAYTSGYVEGMLYVCEGTPIGKLFDRWLNEDVAEGGLTVEMLLDHENKEKGNE